jgi:hypothetical protein
MGEICYIQIKNTHSWNVGRETYGFPYDPFPYWRFMFQG